VNLSATTSSAFTSPVSGRGAYRRPLRRRTDRISRATTFFLVSSARSGA
jgi:hypothetical protein